MMTASRQAILEARAAAASAEIERTQRWVQYVESVRRTGRKTSVAASTVVAEISLNTVPGSLLSAAAQTAGQPALPACAEQHVSPHHHQASSTARTPLHQVLMVPDEKECFNFKPTQDQSKWPRTMHYEAATAGPEPPHRSSIAWLCAGDKFDFDARLASSSTTTSSSAALPRRSHGWERDLFDDVEDDWEKAEFPLVGLLG